jgi:hypothetical protein
MGGKIRNLLTTVAKILAYPYTVRELSNVHQSLIRSFQYVVGIT